jgi:phosphopentomutase
MSRRVFLIVLDSVGIGEAPDAEAYGDAGSNTLAHTATAVGGISLPTLQHLGLGNIPDLLPHGKRLDGVPPTDAPLGRFGAMQERSVGKDTTTGHWEMAGLLLEDGFKLFPPGPPAFPQDLLRAFSEQTGRGFLGNKAASGTAIIEELGAKQVETGNWIVYTSADSVMQIAAHEEVIPLEELYEGCLIARKLCDPLRVGRVIARPYRGTPGSFSRTQNRRDFSLALPEPCILDHVAAHGGTTITVGKLDDIFAGTAISKAYHLENNADAQKATLAIAENQHETLLCFVNLIDFDMLYGHRRNPEGYAHALETTDAFLAELLPLVGPDDLLLITADHGNDPTFRGTDHTREYVPLLAYSPSLPPGSMGVRKGFFDAAQSVAEWLNLPPMTRGTSTIGSP